MSYATLKNNSIDSRNYLLRPSLLMTGLWLRGSNNGNNILLKNSDFSFSFRIVSLREVMEYEVP